MCSEISWRVALAARSWVRCKHWWEPSSRPLRYEARDAQISRSGTTFRPALLHLAGGVQHVVPCRHGPPREEGERRIAKAASTKMTGTMADVGRAQLAVTIESPSKKKAQRCSVLAGPYSPKKLVPLLIIIEFLIHGVEAHIRRSQLGSF